MSTDLRLRGRWVGKFTVSAVAGRLLRESLLYGVAGTASSCAGIVLVPLYTRLFAPADYGLLDLATTAGALLTILCGMQVGSGVARGYYEARDDGRERDLVGIGLMLLVLSGALWTIGGMLVLLRIRAPSETPELGMPVLLSVIPSQVLGFCLLVLRLEQRLPQFLVYSVGDTLLSAVLGMGSVLVLHGGVQGVLWAGTASKVVWMAAAAPNLIRHAKLNWNKAFCREVLQYGIPLLPSVLTKWGQSYASRFVLVAAVGLADLGVFSLAVKLASIVTLIDTAFRMAWDPYAIELMRHPQRESVYSQALNVYLIVMLLVCTSLGALSAGVVALASGPAYGRAAHLVAFMAIGTVWLGTDKFLALGNSIVRKTYWNWAGYGIGAVVNLLALWLTAARWGLLGAGASYCLGAAVGAFAMLWTSQRNHRVPYSPGALLAALGVTALYPAWILVTQTLLSNALPWWMWTAANLLLGLLLSGAVALASLEGAKSGPLVRVPRELLHA